MTGRTAAPSGATAHGIPPPRRTAGLLATVLPTAGTAYLFASAAPGFGGLACALIVLGLVLAVVSLIRQRRPKASSQNDPEEAFEAPRDLWRLRTSVRDTPGRLAQLTAGLAEIGSNIRTVHVHPTADGAVDEILLHAPNDVTAATLRRAVRAAGGAKTTAARADVRELNDLPTRAFTLATRLVDGSVELARALRAVLGQVEIEWCDSEGGERLTEDGMRLRAPGGGLLRIHRGNPEFTPAEFARAQAMAALAATCHTRFQDQGQRVRIAGADLQLRRADRDDVDSVARFYESCSRAARSECSFMPVTAGCQRQVLHRLLTPALGPSLLVQHSDGEVIAMGHLLYDGPDAEIGLLVRDDWQRQGIGSMLSKRLVEAADAAGATTVTAQTTIHNTAIAQTLRSAGLKISGVSEPGEWSWSRPGRPAHEDPGTSLCHY